MTDLGQMDLLSKESNQENTPHLHGCHGSNDAITSDIQTEQDDMEEDESPPFFSIQTTNYAEEQGLMSSNTASGHAALVLSGGSDASEAAHAQGIDHMRSGGKHISNRHRKQDMDHMLEFEGAGPYWSMPVTRTSRAALRHAPTDSTLLLPGCSSKDMKPVTDVSQADSMDELQNLNSPKLEIPFKRVKLATIDIPLTTDLQTPEKSTGMPMKLTQATPTSKRGRPPKHWKRLKSRAGEESEEAEESEGTINTIDHEDDHSEELESEESGEDHNRSKVIRKPAGRFTSRRGASRGGGRGGGRGARGFGIFQRPIVPRGNRSSNIVAESTKHAEPHKMVEQLKLLGKSLEQAFAEHIHGVYHGKHNHSTSVILPHLTTIPSQFVSKVVKTPPSNHDDESTEPGLSSDQISYFCSLAILGIPYSNAVPQAGLEKLHCEGLEVQYLRIQETAEAASLFDVVRAARQVPHISDATYGSVSISICGISTELNHNQTLTSTRSHSPSDLDNLFSYIDGTKNSSNHEGSHRIGESHLHFSRVTTPSMVLGKQLDTIHPDQLSKLDDCKNGGEQHYKSALAAVCRATLDDWYICLVRAITTLPNSCAEIQSGLNQEEQQRSLSGVNASCSMNMPTPAIHPNFDEILPRHIIHELKTTPSVEPPVADRQVISSINPILGSLPVSLPCGGNSGHDWIDFAPLQTTHLMDIPLPGCYSDIPESLASEFEFQSLSTSGIADGGHVSKINKVYFTKLLRALRGCAGPSNVPQPQPQSPFELRSIRCRDIHSVVLVDKNSFVVVYDEETILRPRLDYENLGSGTNTNWRKACALLNPWLGPMSGKVESSMSGKDSVFITRCTTLWVKSPMIPDRHSKRGLLPISSVHRASLNNYHECVLSPASQIPQGAERVVLPSLQLHHMTRDSVHEEINKA